MSTCIISGWKTMLRGHSYLPLMEDPQTTSLKQIIEACIMGCPTENNGHDSTMYNIITHN